MKFGQLIESNMSHIFVKSYTQNAMKKLLPDSFLKTWFRDISGLRDISGSVVYGLL